MSPVKSPEKFSARDAGKTDKIVGEKDDAEELPPGWTKEVKVRKKGSTTKIDRYYTDPVTGYIFRSLRDAQRYIQTGELGRLAKKPKTKESEEPSEVKEKVSESETIRLKRAPTDNSELPARASKRLAGNNVDSPQPSPSPAPVSQPKTRQATRLAGDALSPPTLPEPKTRQATRLAGVAVDALPTPSPPVRKTRQATRLSEVAVAASPPSPPSASASVSKPEPKSRHATRLVGVAVDAQPPSPPAHTTHQTIRAEVTVDAPLPDTRTNRQTTNQSGPLTSPVAPKTRQAARQAGTKTDSPPPLPPDSKTHQATSLTGTEIGLSPPSQPEPRTRQAKRVSGIRDNASPPQPKTRRATQQAGIKINTPPPSPPDTRASRQATRTKLVNLATQEEKDKKTEDKSITVPLLNQENNNKQIETRPTRSLPSEDQAPPTVPPVNLEKQKFPVVNPTVSNSSDMKADPSINFSMNDLWTDPCIEFAVKTLTGSIPFPDLNKVESFTTTPVQVPLEELWTDPCIEFAVKTLTGVIPVGEDGYLPQRPASSTNPQGPYQFSSHDVGMNLCQTNGMSKHYETGHKNKQQDAVFPTLGDGGFQKSGTFVNGSKFVNGSNGQCSKSRFFQ